MDSNVAKVRQIVHDYFKDPKRVEMWFKTPNPLLGELSPNELIRIGQSKKLLRFVSDALQGY